ncbi:MAG: DUF2062 domain-containing protein [Desulfobulbaceae bacterium]
MYDSAKAQPPDKTTRYRRQGYPFTLAKGISIGVFAGQTPTIPFQTAITLSLALIFRAAKIPACWPACSPPLLPIMPHG